MLINYNQRYSTEFNQEFTKLIEYDNYILLEFTIENESMICPKKSKTFHFELSKLDLSQFGDFGIEIDKSVEYKVCCKSKLLLSEIEQNPYKVESFKNLFIQAKAMELLLLNLNYINNLSDSKCFNCKFLNNSDDRAKVVRAREIIDLNINDCPKIPILSTMVGINQCYLKQGFKELFGMNIGEYISDQKLTQAKNLLATTQKPISEIADVLGYSNLSNFSNSFKNQLGISPIEYRGN